MSLKTRNLAGFGERFQKPIFDAALFCQSACYRFTIFDTLDAESIFYDNFFDTLERSEYFLI